MNECRAPVFNRVRSSFVDGYGIRTTVFLKGCPLRCIWCCNPEGQSFLPELRVIYEDCSGCGECVEACAAGALRMDGGALCVDRAKCNACGACIGRCTAGALEIFGQMCTVDEVFDYVRRDKRYYDASGGGVTIGGGEASCYPEFCLALIEKCHAAGIRAAIDTCGYTVSPRSLDALKAADLLLFDLKGIDPVLHEKNTGVRNERILENLRTLSAMGKPIIIRIPVITGYNDSDAELDGMIALLRECRSVERVDLIPVHEFGKVKYRQIGLPYTLHAAPVPPERQQALKKKFEDAGFCTQIGG